MEIGKNVFYEEKKYIHSSTKGNCFDAYRVFYRGFIFQISTREKATAKEILLEERLFRENSFGIINGP